MSQQNNMGIQTPEQKPFWRRIPGFQSGKPWKMILASLGYGFILLVVVVVFLSRDTQQTGTPDDTIPLDEYKAQCVVVSYDDLARETEKYVGTKVHLTGEVVQVIEEGANMIYRINVTKTEFGFYEDTIWVNYSLKPGEKRILENDIVELWGEVKGRRTYTAVLGQKITIPEINARHIEVLGKKD